MVEPKKGLTLTFLPLLDRWYSPALEIIEPPTMRTVCFIFEDLHLYLYPFVKYILWGDLFAIMYN